MNFVQTIKKVNPFTFNDINGAHGRIRTSDRLVRRRLHESIKSITYCTSKFGDCRSGAAWCLSRARKYTEIFACL